MLAEGIRPVYASGECEIDLTRCELRVGGSPVLGARFRDRVNTLSFNSSLMREMRMIKFFII